MMLENESVMFLLHIKEWTENSIISCLGIGFGDARESVMFFTSHKRMD